MKCPKCNIEFEGIFCPECGLKVEKTPLEKEKLEDEKQQEILLEQQKIEREKLEFERQKHEDEKQKEVLLEQQKIEREKLEFERQKYEDEKQKEVLLEKQRQEEKNERTVNGVTYETKEQAANAMKEIAEFEDIKRRMLSARNQEERKAILESIKFEPETSEVQRRWNYLREKVNMTVPAVMKRKNVVGILAIISFILLVVYGTVTTLIGEEPKVLVAMAVIAAFALWIFFIWWIIAVIKAIVIKKSKKEFWYIEDI